MKRVNEHPSLISPKKLDRKKLLLTEINIEIEHLTAITSEDKMYSMIKEILDIVKKANTTTEEERTLKMQVLQKLKTKLETT